MRIIRSISILLILASCASEQSQKEREKQSDSIPSNNSSITKTHDETSENEEYIHYIATPHIEHYFIDSMILDSMHRYGGGDVFGTIYSYSDSSRVLVVDSSSSGEYGYDISFFEFNKCDRTLKGVHIKRLRAESNDSTKKWEYYCCEEIVRPLDNKAILQVSIPGLPSSEYVHHIENLDLDTVSISDTIIPHYLRKEELSWSLDLLQE